MSQQRPTAIVQNNTGADVPVTLFQYGGIPSSNNAKTTYQYALPASVFLNASRVSIQVRGSSTVAYQLFSGPVGELTAQGVADALNKLNLGTSWYSKEIGGVPRVFTANDNLLFGDLTLDDPDPTGVNFNFDVSNAGGQINIDADVNAGTVIIVNTATPAVSTSSQGFSVGVILAFEVTAPATTILRLLVTKQTTAGVVTIISQIIEPGDTLNAQLTIASDALSYTVSIEQPEFWLPSQGTETPAFGVFQTNYFPENAPAPTFTLDDQVQAYIWIEFLGGGAPVWGSSVIPYSTAPDFIGTGVASAINAWIFDTLLAETGEAPAGDPAIDPPADFFLGWGSAEVAPGQIGTLMGNGYGMGNMNIAPGTEKILFIKFSKFT